MTVENISWSISTKECCRPRRELNLRPPGLQSDGASNWATEAGCFLGKMNEKNVSICCLLKILLSMLSINYHIRPIYRTYPYKRTVKKFCSLQITTSVLFSLLLYKGICCGYSFELHQLCINKLMQFKWVPTTYAFVKKVRKNRIVIIR